MEHLNFCRQMVKQFTGELLTKSQLPYVRELRSHCIDMALASQKFMLPDGGILYDDPDYKALDETVSLSLPYPVIAVEFLSGGSSTPSCGRRADGFFHPSKTLFFAREGNDLIKITPVVWADFAGMWIPYPEAAITRTHYLDRSLRLDGYTPFKIFQNPEARIGGHPIPASDYANEIGVLLNLLNVLHCSNVHIERSEARNPKKVTRTSNNRALPFDSYHVLAINAPCKARAGLGTGSHRSPREHLRRGHIRHLTSGRRIWVNATVVAAGRGSGSVKKDYVVRFSGSATTPI